MTEQDQMPEPREREYPSEEDERELRPHNTQPARVPGADDQEPPSPHRPGPPPEVPPPVEI